MSAFLKIYLPIYLLLYLLAAFVLPTYRTWKQTGINPITFGKADTAHNYIGFVMKVLIVLLFATVLLYSFSPSLYQYVVPITYIQNDTTLFIGLIVIHLSLIWIMIAQFQMSTSWRIGIDEVNETLLKTSGIFSVSRNPIFFGMTITMVGVFLILSNALTFFLVVTTYIIIQIQIRLEEAFLQNQHGNSYVTYKNKVRRWL
jgi:protein-S-isoprenylcysteine O-methyltransferase Ste14